MFEIDRIDQEILSILLQDSRMKHSQIAKLVGISKGRVGYRINKLIDSKLILGYKVNMNAKLLGFTEYILMIKLKKSGKRARDEGVEILKKHKSVFWIGTTMGVYDFRIALLAKNSEELNTQIANIHHLFNHNIEECKSYTRIQKIAGKKHNISYHTQAPTKSQSAKLNNEVKLDTKDWKIIKLLAHSPKLTYREIGSQLGVTGEDIKYRFEKIKKSKVIKNFSIGIDFTKLGYIWWNIIFNIKDKQLEEKIISYLINHPQVSNVITTIGSADMNSTWYSKTIAEANEFILAFREHFEPNISDIELIAINDSLKFPQLAEVIFQDK